MQAKNRYTNGTRAVMAHEPDPEVLPKAERRQFSADYKLRVLAEADRCSEPGQIGRCCGARDSTRRICRSGASNESEVRWVSNVGASRTLRRPNSSGCSVRTSGCGAGWNGPNISSRCKKSWRSSLGQRWKRRRATSNDDVHLYRTGHGDRCCGGMSCPGHSEKQPLSPAQAGERVTQAGPQTSELAAGVG